MKKNKIKKKKKIRRRKRKYIKGKFRKKVSTKEK